VIIIISCWATGGYAVSTIKAVLRDELARLKKLKARYKNEIAVLPTGSISIKNRKGKKYAYAAYRENGKVKTDYVGPAESEEVAIIQKQISQRKKIESLLKTVNQQISELEKSLHGKKI